MQCLGARSYHQGHVLSVNVNTLNPKWVCTGGAMGSVLLWDLNNPLDAVTPGKSNFEHQIVKNFFESGIPLFTYLSSYCFRGALDGISVLNTYWVV